MMLRKIDLFEAEFYLEKRYDPVTKKDIIILWDKEHYLAEQDKIRQYMIKLGEGKKQ